MVLDSLCSNSSGRSQDQKSRVCSSFIRYLWFPCDECSSQKSGGKTKAICSDRCPDSADCKTDGLLLPIRTYDSIFCSCIGNAADAAEEIWCSGGDPGSVGGIFQTILRRALSDRCLGWICGGTGGQYTGGVGCEEEDGK